MSTVAIASALAQAPIFSGFSQADLNQLSQRAREHHFEAGAMLFAEGEPCKGLYILTAGRVRIFKTSPQGREQVLSVETPVSSMAEIPVFDGDPYPASGVAIEPSTAVLLLRSDLHAFLIEHPRLALQILTAVGQRLRRLVSLVEELSFTTVRQRLIGYLLQLANARGNAGPVECELPESHQALAHRIGTVRELVSRNLARLQAEGLIAVDGRTIRIAAPAALAEQLEP